MHGIPSSGAKFLFVKSGSNTGALIRAARRRNGWSQKLLANKLRVSESTISHWETGTPPTVDHMNDLVTALGLSADEMIVARGVRLTPIEAADLPLELIDALLTIQKRDPQALEDLIPFVVRLAGKDRPAGGLRP